MFYENVNLIATTSSLTPVHKKKNKEICGSIVVGNAFHHN